MSPVVIICVLFISTPVCDCADMLSPQGGAREPGRLDLNIVHSSQDRLRRRAQRSRVTSALNRTHRPFQIHQCAADSFFFFLLRTQSPCQRVGDILGNLQCAKDISRIITGLQSGVMNFNTV